MKITTLLTFFVFFISTSVISQTCINSNPNHLQLECDTFLFSANAESITNDIQILGYYWTFGDGNTSTEENPEHTYSSDGMYNVTLVVVGFDTLTGDCCKTTETISLDVMCGPGTSDDCGSITGFLDLNENCSANVTYSVNQNQIQLSPGWTITAYDWNHIALNNGIVVNGGGNPSTVNLSDNFNDGGWNSTLTITAVNNFTGETCRISRTEFLLSGGSDGSPSCDFQERAVFDENIKLNVYPNPTSNELFFKVENYNISSKDKCKFVLTNFQGIQVLSGNFNTSQREQFLDTSVMDKGVYFLEVTLNKEQLETKKVIIK